MWADVTSGVLQLRRLRAFHIIVFRIRQMPVAQCGSGNDIASDRWIVPVLLSDSVKAWTFFTCSLFHPPLPDEAFVCIAGMTR